MPRDAGNQIQRGLVARQDANNQRTDSSVKHHKVSTRTQIIGAGESSFDVPFPVTFADLPAISYSYELADNQMPAAGQFPVVSAGVAFWKTVPTTIPGHFNYTGAVVVAVAQGNPQYLWLHFHFEGLAYRNPINDLSVPDPVE